MVKNLPSNAGDAGSIPGWGTVNEIPHTVERVSLCELEPVCHSNEPECHHEDLPQPTK